MSFDAYVSRGVTAALLDAKRHPIAQKALEHIARRERALEAIERFVAPTFTPKGPRVQCVKFQGKTATYTVIDDVTPIPVQYGADWCARP